jgi:hypothetical protein
MPLDPARIAETKSWFEKAASDLRAADHDLIATPPLTDDVVFHAQQAAEKAMKGYLSWHDQPFHDGNCFHGSLSPVRFSRSHMADRSRAPWTKPMMKTLSVLTW